MNLTLKFKRSRSREFYTPHSRGFQPLLTTPEVEEHYRQLWRKWEELSEQLENSSGCPSNPRTIKEGHRVFAYEAVEHYWGLIQSLGMAYNIDNWRIRNRILEGRLRSKPRKRGPSAVVRRRALKLVVGVDARP